MDETFRRLTFLGCGVGGFSARMPSTKPTQFDAAHFVAVVRELYLERRSAMIELRHTTGVDSFFFRDGELFIDRDHIAAARVAPLLGRVGPGERPASQPKLRAEVEWMAREVTTHHDPQAKLVEKPSGAVEVVGPLPTLCFLMELAVHGCDEKTLVHRLGGPGVRLRNSDQSPALDQLPALEPDMAEVMASLESPCTAAELARGGAGALARLRAAAKLWAIGLVRGDTSDEGGSAEQLVSPRILASFSERIASRLENEPVELVAEEHRNRVAELLAKLGELDFYQLLGLEPGVGSQEISAAYNEVASVVHPSHARRLGLEGREEAMKVLFERATEAYLVLSDPRRRASYHTMSGITIELEVDNLKRQQEKRELARQNYLRAARCLDMMEYSTAIDLLKEAVRMDPQAEYFSRLGVAQSKNPNWLPQAVGNFERAVELSPDDAGIRVAFAKTLESCDRVEEARREYGRALELMPDNPSAREALERLGGTVSPQATGNFRSLFNRGR